MMATPDDIRALNALERSLDKDMALRRSFRLRIPLLDTDVLSVEEHTVVTSLERYMESASALDNVIEQDSGEALSPDPLPRALETDPITESDTETDIESDSALPPDGPFPRR